MSFLIYALIFLESNLHNQGLKKNITTRGSTQVK